MADNENQRPVELTDGLKAQLISVSTATLVSQLQRRGIRSTFFNGLKPLSPGQHMVGYARTLRYVPMREDLLGTLGAGVNAQRRAVEGVQLDDVLVIEARYEAFAGTIGDIFTMRVKALGGAGVITDGALRDTPAIADIGLPVYHQSSHASTLSRMHLPLDVNVPIACAGVLVMPGDIIVGDAEGATVIPAALVEEVARDSIVMEEEETFAIGRVAAGESSIGLFPLSKERRGDYEKWKAERGQ